MAKFVLTKMIGAKTVSGTAGGSPNYEVNAVNGQVNPADPTTYVAPYDSGSILGTVPPGKAGLKLIDGTQQFATTAKADSTAGVNGNFVGHVQSGDSDEDAAYGPTNGESKGYSLLGE
jgi:hypothetical protein